MNSSKSKKLVIRILALLIALLLVGGLFAEFFRTNTIDKELQQSETKGLETRQKE